MAERRYQRHHSDQDGGDLWRFDKDADVLTLEGSVFGHFLCYMSKWNLDVIDEKKSRAQNTATPDRFFLAPIFAKREKNEDYGVDALDSGMVGREQIGG